jgi:ATP-binding cassette subfamily B protein
VILVMENGSIVEQGSHEDLLAAKGAYHRLYQAQFTAPVAHDA